MQTELPLSIGFWGLNRTASTIIPKKLHARYKEVCQRKGAFQASFPLPALLQDEESSRNSSVGTECIKHFINNISTEVPAVAELEGNHARKFSQNPALKVLLLLHCTACGSCMASAGLTEVRFLGKYLKQGLFCLSPVTFKEQLRTPGFFSRQVQGMNPYVLANRVSLTKTTPLAIAWAIANQHKAAGICYDQCTATTQLFILDRPLRCFGDKKKTPQKKTTKENHKNPQPTPRLSWVVLMLSRSVLVK